jgi:hypothetical protein
MHEMRQQPQLRIQGRLGGEVHYLHLRVRILRVRNQTFLDPMERRVSSAAVCVVPGVWLGSCRS